MLSTLAPIAAGSRADLLAQLRPGVDGLVVVAGGRQGLSFRRVAWDQLPKPAEFLNHLHLKAGLAPRSWPPGMRAWRFSAVRVGRQAGGFGEPARAA